MYQSVATLDLSEILKPKSVGEPVNNHVVLAVREPAPDYEAMRRLVANPDAVTLFRHEHRIYSST